MLKFLLASVCFSVASGFINGGSVVRQKDVDNKYPWFVSLVSCNHGLYMPFCGGAMVAPGTIVTAAHCLADQGGPDSRSLQETFAVIGFAGSYSVTQKDIPKYCSPEARDKLEEFIKGKSPKARVVDIDEFKKPIHYKKVEGYDIMLVFLAKKSCPDLLSKMPVVKVYGQCGGDDKLVPGTGWLSEKKKLTVLGFGATVGEVGQYSNDLKKLTAEVQSVGTSDSLCNLNVPLSSRVPSVACSSEEEETHECDGGVTFYEWGCKPGVKTARGDSGGPWVAMRNGERVKAFTVSRGVEGSNALITRDSWFQDFILHGVKNFDKCAEQSVEGADIFVGFEASLTQYCQNANCGKCMDSKLVDKDCMEKQNCAIAPQVPGCTTIPYPVLDDPGVIPHGISADDDYFETQHVNMTGMKQERQKIVQSYQALSAPDCSGHDSGHDGLFLSSAHAPFALIGMIFTTVPYLLTDRKSVV